MGEAPAKKPQNPDVSQSQQFTQITKANIGESKKQQIQNHKEPVGEDFGHLECDLMDDAELDSTVLTSIQEEEFRKF